MPANEATRKEVPGRMWFRVGTRMVRIVENTIDGHVVEVKIAQARVRRRADRRNIDERPQGGV